MRRDFTPFAEDLALLEAREAPWETVKENNRFWYILHDYKTPPGYTPETVSVAFMVPPSYPSTQIDMVYFYPQLQRVDGQAPRALSSHSFDNKSWQRWSRHRPSPNDWQDGVDYLGTHLTYIESALITEAGGTTNEI